MSTINKTKQSSSTEREELVREVVRNRLFGSYTDRAAIVFSIIFRNRELADLVGWASRYPRELSGKKNVTVSEKMKLIERVTKDMGFSKQIAGLSRILLGLKTPATIAAKAKAKKSVRIKAGRNRAYNFVASRTAAMVKVCNNRFNVAEKEIEVNKNLSPLGQEVERYLASNSFGCQQDQVCNLMSQYLGEKIANNYEDDEDGVDGLDSEEIRLYGVIDAGGTIAMITHEADSDYEMGIDQDGDSVHFSDEYCVPATNEEIVSFINALPEKVFQKHFGMIAGK